MFHVQGLKLISQEGHRQAVYWGRGLTFQKGLLSQTKQEPTIDPERFTMLFRYLSPWDFGEHSKSIAARAFNVRVAIGVSSEVIYIN